MVLLVLGYQVHQHHAQLGQPRLHLYHAGADQLGEETQIHAQLAGIVDLLGGLYIEGLLPGLQELDIEVRVGAVQPGGQSHHSRHIRHLELRLGQGGADLRYVLAEIEGGQLLKQCLQLGGREELQLLHEGGVLLEIGVEAGEVLLSGQLEDGVLMAQLALALNFVPQLLDELLQLLALLRLLDGVVDG